MSAKPDTEHRDPGDSALILPKEFPDSVRPSLLADIRHVQKLTGAGLWGLPRHVAGK